MERARTPETPLPPRVLDALYPDSLTPEQWKDMHLPGINSGEKRLWAAQLFIVANTLMLGKDSRCLGRSVKEAREWLCSDDDYVGSFTYVCDVLGLHPAYMRAILLARGARPLRRHVRNSGFGRNRLKVA